MTEEYRRYLLSAHWRRTRQKALVYHGRRCAVCGTTKRLQVHHLTYERLGGERMTDFKVLCKAHHPKGRYSAWAIKRDRTSYRWLRVLEWVLFLPFRILRWLVRKAFGVPKKK